MAKYRTLNSGDVYPASFVAAMEEFVSTLASNFAITGVGATSITLAAGTGSAQVSLGIGGLWRFVSSNVTAAHPGGAAGSYDIFAVASANVFGGGDSDTSDYTFGLQIKATGVTPTGNYNGHAITQYRKVGTLHWTGSVIDSISVTGLGGGSFVGYPAGGALAGAFPNPTLAAGALAGLAAGGSLAGTFPNPTLAANSVGASQITDGSVGAAEIADGSVGAAEIADGSVGTAELAAGAVTLAKQEILAAVRCADASVTVTEDATYHIFLFSTEVYDTASMHSTSSNTSRFVAPVTGLYAFEGHARMNETGTPGGAWSAQLVVSKNGSGIVAEEIVAGDSGDSGDFSLGVGDHVSLAAGDYLELKLVQTLGTPEQVFDVRFAMALLGRIA